MNGTLDDPQVEAAYTPPPFPAWPPPSGGYPNTVSEMGPVTNPYPYGTPQNANIAIGGPAPIKNATHWPDPMPPLNGQNQSPPSGWPVWSGWCTLPDKAPPSLSQIP
jgi:hypothetical protein